MVASSVRRAAIHDTRSGAAPIRTDVLQDCRGAPEKAAFADRPKCSTEVLIDEPYFRVSDASVERSSFSAAIRLRIA